MRLTEQTRYALRVLAVCAEHHPKSLRVSDLSEATGITEFNIFKLLKVITKAGFVETMRGRAGGVKLAIDPGSLSVGVVVRALEPRFQVCGPAASLVPKQDLAGAIDQAVDRSIGKGIGAFLETIDGISIRELVPG